jgi:low affinity Fe/Cu permease
MRASKQTSLFGRFAKWTARAIGRPQSFGIAVLLVLAWAAAGPFVGFSDTWQLMINTSTTVLTFLMLFLLQGSQNRDAEAIQVKLDELIRSMKGAHLALLDLEEMEEKELDSIRAGYVKLARRAREDLARGVDDTDSREV